MHSTLFPEGNCDDASSCRRRLNCKNKASWNGSPQKVSKPVTHTCPCAHHNQFRHESAHKVCATAYLSAYIRPEPLGLIREHLSNLTFSNTMFLTLRALVFSFYSRIHLNSAMKLRPCTFGTASHNSSTTKSNPLLKLFLYQSKELIAIRNYKLNNSDAPYLFDVVTH